MSDKDPATLILLTFRIVVWPGSRRSCLWLDKKLPKPSCMMMMETQAGSEKNTAIRTGTTRHQLCSTDRLVQDVTNPTKKKKKTINHFLAPELSKYSTDLSSPFAVEKLKSPLQTFKLFPVAVTLRLKRSSSRVQLLPGKPS